MTEPIKSNYRETIEGTPLLSETLTRAGALADKMAQLLEAERAGDATATACRVKLHKFLNTKAEELRKQAKSRADKVVQEALITIEEGAILLENGLNDAGILITPGEDLEEILQPLPETAEGEEYQQAVYDALATPERLARAQANLIVHAAYAVKLAGAGDLLREWWEKEINRPAPKVAVDFSGIVHVSNFPGDRAIHRGLAMLDQPGAWQTDTNEGLKYYRDREADLVYQPPEIFPAGWWGECREASLNALDRRFLLIRNDHAADIIDVLFHHWNTMRKPNNSPTAVEKVGITLSQICQYRDVVPHRNNVDAVYRAMRDIRAFRLRDGGIDEALFEISFVKLQNTLWENDLPPAANTGFVYSPGYFLAKSVPEEPIYFAPHVRKLWELDPHKYSKAKRLARYLRGEWRMNTQKYLRAAHEAPSRYRSWRAILADAGIDASSKEVTDEPRRFIESINKAIATLYDYEAVRECGPSIYHPEDRAREANLPRKGVLSAWLDLRVSIEPAADVCDALRDTHAKRLAWAAQGKQEPKNKRRGRPRKDSK